MKMKKILSGILALTATVGCVGMFSACETAHPKIEMTLAFDGETYELDYTLYRKVAPATVKHFLTLVEGGYYKDLCVHNYADSRMYTGAYKANTDGTLDYQKYYDIVKTYENFPSTVFTEEGDSTYTLYGEFSNNSFEVENGAKNEQFGSLSMFYTDKGSNEDRVSVVHPEAGEAKRYYKYNSATSEFFISLKSSSTSSSNYCTFALLDEDSKDELEALQDAIEEYVDGDDEALQDVTVEINKDDLFVNDYNMEETYSVLQKSVVIQSIAIKRA